MKPQGTRMKVRLTADIYQRIAAAKVFIDEHYREHIDLEQIAQHAFLSRFHFHRLFTRIYKRTPHQHITRIRLEAAKVLLANEDISIAEVCNSVGFESIGSFILLFRRKNGYSPKRYRDKALAQKRLAREQPKRFIPHCFIEQYSLGVSPADNGT